MREGGALGAECRPSGWDWRRAWAAPTLLDPGMLGRVSNAVRSVVHEAVAIGSMAGLVASTLHSAGLAQHRPLGRPGPHLRLVLRPAPAPTGLAGKPALARWFGPPTDV